jgi:hypothetical protein
MLWMHTVKVERPAQPVVDQDQITGAATIVDGTATVLYNGAGDMQHRRRTTFRDGDNEKTPIADANVYLKDESTLWDMIEGDLITVTDDNDRVLLKGRVLQIDRLSGMLSAQQLDEPREE